jgi:hypothetical protein
MHPEHTDPEAETLRMWQPGIKGIRLHGHELAGLEIGGIQEDAHIFNHSLICQDIFILIHANV